MGQAGMSLILWEPRGIVSEPCRFLRLTVSKSRDSGGPLGG